MRDKIQSYNLIEWGDMCCTPHVRKLESDYEELEKQKAWRVGEIQRQIRVNNNYQSKISELENNIEIAIDELNVVVKWKDAYPEDVFSPLTTEQYHGMCKASGISVDRVSAHVLRKIVIAYSESAEKVLEKITGES